MLMEIHNKVLEINFSSPTFLVNISKSTGILLYVTSRENFVQKSLLEVLSADVKAVD